MMKLTIGHLYPDLLDVYKRQRGRSGTGRCRISFREGELNISRIRVFGA